MIFEEQLGPDGPLKPSLHKRLLERFAEDYQSHKTGSVLFVRKHELLPAMEELQEKFHFYMLLDICGVHNFGRPAQSLGPFPGGFEVVYHLLNLEEHFRLRVRVPTEEEEDIPSVGHLWKGAQWFEREAQDMLGLKFLGTPNDPLLLPRGFQGAPLRKSFPLGGSQEVMSVKEESSHFPFDPNISTFERNCRDVVNLGPYHPSTKNSLRIICEVDGEIIKRSKLEIGFLHRGIEKIAESKTYHQFIPFTDRLNYFSGAMNNIGWCKAVEELLNLELTERARALRMVLAELSRTMDHLLCIGLMAENLGASTNYWICLEQRERLTHVLEKWSGARVNLALVRIGGMAKDIPSRWINECMDVVRIVSKNIEKVHKMLSQSRIWIERTKVGNVGPKEAILWGYTGPCLRASGINYDIRKVTPYYFYDQVDFDVPLGINGDCFDRYLVRMEEMRQSLRIVSQLLEHLPSGTLNHESMGEASSEKDLKAHFAYYLEGHRPPVGEIYSFTEAANGELGFYIVSDGNQWPFRVKIRPPCFPIFASFEELSRNAFLADAVAILGSMNVVPGELDR